MLKRRPIIQLAFALLFFVQAASAEITEIRVGRTPTLSQLPIYVLEAEKLIEKASTLAPNDAFIMDSLGWVKYRRGETNDAARLLRKAYELQPNAEIGAHLGEVLWKSGDQAKAKAAWREARKLEPDNDTLVKTLKRLQVNTNDL